MTDAIPEDVMQAAREDRWLEAKALARKAIWAEDGRGMIGRERNYLEDRIARAILSEQEKSRKRVEELEAGVASRDKFIVDEGLWGDFVETLPLRETPQTFKRLSLRKEGTDA